jgi:hypothetical protein
MDMYPPPAQYEQAQRPGEAASIRVDVSQYIPPTAVSVTILVSISPPSGAVLAYAPGAEDAPVLFRGPASTGEIRLSGPYVFFQLLAGTTHYDIQYLNWRSPT